MIFTLVLALGAATVDGDALRHRFERIQQASQTYQWDAHLAWETGGRTARLRQRHRIRDGLRQDQFNGRGWSLWPAGHCQISLYDNLAKYYQLQDLGTVQVAGRIADQWLLTPVDELRFGYLIAQDRETGVPLAATVMQSSGQPLARTQVLNIQIEKAAQRTGQGDSGSCTPRRRSASHSPDGLGWLPTRVPPAYQLLDSSHNQDEQLWTLFYSDGLSSFSVRVQAGVVPPPTAISSTSGAQSAAMGSLWHDGQLYLGAVVGEMPPRAALELLASLEPDIKP